MTLSHRPAKMDETVLPCKSEERAIYTMLSRADSPALLVHFDGTVLYANPAAHLLAEACAQRNPELCSHIDAAKHNQAPVTARIVLANTDSQAFEITILPYEKEQLIILARDASFETNLTNALLQSRDLYKDIMYCSAEFGWETDKDGIFTYITPDGALGWATQEMTGQKVQTLFSLDHTETQNIFSTRTDRRDTIIRAQNRTGEKVYLSVSAIPVTKSGGIWTGARGVARDITGDYEKEQALKLDQARQALLARIVFAIRSEADPRDILTSATLSAADALRAEGGWALKCTHTGCNANNDMSAELGGAKEPALLALDTLKQLKTSTTVSQDKAHISIGHDNNTCLFVSTGTLDTVTATLGFVRDTAAQPWRAHELELISEMADHLAIALKQADMISRLETLSRIDDLTGILNRRALFNDIAPRINHQKRHPHCACFLYVDLDHFKQVNDRLGHAAGDNVLRTLGRILRETSRAGDLEGRIGGDEFALWLEDTDIDGARQKAERLMKTVPLLRDAAGDKTVPLSMSIGIAVSDPARWHTPAALADVADKALYRAKRAGRSQIVISDDDTKTDKHGVKTSEGGKQKN